MGYDNLFRLCSSLWHRAATCDLRNRTLAEAWDEVIPRVRDLRSQTPEFLEKCRRCGIINLCLWCPAHAGRETGSMDEWIEYFCRRGARRLTRCSGMTRRPRRSRPHFAQCSTSRITLQRGFFSTAVLPVTQ